MWSKKKSWSFSALGHFSFVVGLVFFHRLQVQTEAPPVEISAILNSTNPPNKTQEHKEKQPPPQKAPRAPAPPVAVTNHSAPSTTTPLSPSASSKESTNSAYDGPISEEYEVGEMPVLLNEVRVPYPAEAKAKGISGNVLFDLVISPEGKVAESKVISSPDPSLSTAAMAAIKEFRFKPAKMADKPVAIRIRYSYRFILK